MFDQLATFFRHHVKKIRSSDDVATTECGYRLCAAALLVEMMRADHYVGDAERKALMTFLEDSFELATADAKVLLRQAEYTATDAISLYQFTAILNAELDSGQKEHLIKLMWRIALVDGQLDQHEEYLVRKVADLLYVPHNRFIRAKLCATDDSQKGKIIPKRT